MEPSSTPRRLAKFIQPHLNDRSPDRRLRVGYVSPDFRSHPVGRFLLPLLESHDRGSFEIFCYASVDIPDAMTDRCRAHADVWRDVLGLSDEQVADAIRQDRIDILVDLTMHMANNRLLVFARKPAPVQVTYLAYCGTTGLGTMDYRLTDPYLDPPGQDERFYSEQSVRLPETYWCYRPAIETPPVNALPALAAGHVTLRLPEQLLQSDRPDACRLEPAAASGARVAVAPARPRRQPSRPGAGCFWPSKAFRRSGWHLSTSCPWRNTSAFTSGSTWPWTRFPTAAAPRPAMPCGWACRW